MKGFVWKTGETPSEKARLRVVYALMATAFCLPLNIFAMEFCFVIAIILAAYYSWKYDVRRVSWMGIFMPAGLFAVISLISLIGSPKALFGLGFYAFTVLQYILMYALLILFVRTASERHLVMVCLLVSAAGTVLYGIYQYAHMLTLHEAEWVDNSAFPLLKRRMYSTLYNPNLYSAFLLMIMGGTASMSIWTRHTWHRVGYLTLFAALGLCLILTYSRGAWLSVAALVFFFGLVWDKRLWLLFLLVPPVLLFYHGGVTDRLLSIFYHSEADTSVSMRLDMWYSAIEMIIEHPLLGVGWGAFKFVYPVYNELIQEAGITIFHAHNMFLNIWAETGILGFVCFFWFFYGNAYYGWKLLKMPQIDTFDRAAATMMIAAVVSQTICGFSDYDLFSTQISLTFWLICGIFANAYIECKK